MVIGAHIWEDNTEQSKLLFALQNVFAITPETKIILFSTSTLFNLPHNFLQVTINLKPKNKLLLYYWYQYKLPKLIIKHNINTFISNAGILASDKTLAQFLFIENQHLLTERNSFFKTRISESTSKAKKIFITDKVLTEQFKKKFPKQADKLQHLNFNINKHIILFTEEELESIKEKYTGGFDYYLFTIDVSTKAHIVTVLKAFSQLKKWQKTSIKLVLSFEKEIDENLLPDFKNYKYKNDVILIKKTGSNKLQLTASAFAYIFLADYNFRENVYDALQYNIPVIAIDNIDNHLLFNQAIAYTALSVDGIATQLQTIYKDEMFKKKLLQKAENFLADFDNKINSQKFIEALSN